MIARAASEERARILGIQALAVPGTEALVAELVADPEVTVEAAGARIMEAALDAPGAGAHLGIEDPANDSKARVQGAMNAARKAGVVK